MEDDIKSIRTISDIKNIFINVFPIFFKRKKHLGIFSMCFYRVEKKYKNKKFNLNYLINNEKYKLKLYLGKGIHFKIGGFIYYFNIYKLKVDTSKVKNNPPQNLCLIDFEFADHDVHAPIVYNVIYYKNYLGKVGKLYNYDDMNLACYFRQTKMNSIGLTVRNKNNTDKFSERVKIFFAKLLSLITPPSKVILMYEKECNKYEESASVLYERLIDRGYNNVKYIIKKDSPHLEFIKDKYKKNIIYAYTFSHYYNFFKCKKFIGTETVPHSIELRAANQYITKKMIKKKYKQVFLQHGVMYMVALNPVSRGAFLKGGNEMPEDAKIVVSSKLEAQHFIDLGGFNEEDLYVSGLPFYDRTIKNKDADKIVIMLTWRSWEYNILTANYKEANYYKMVNNILKNIPEEYKDKTYVLPHPLILEKFKNTDMEKMIPKIISYDKILEETALLITDYSSIAYSAFYRGANVIFAWEELEECMEKYESHLMLNKDNVFGDVSYKFSDIKELVKKNYLKPQSDKYKERYKKIVEFHDGKNTDRLIEFLKRDGLI